MKMPLAQPLKGGHTGGRYMAPGRLDYHSGISTHGVFLTGALPDQEALVQG